MNELERLTQICETIGAVIQDTKDMDHYEYERVQNYISSKYGVDLPLKQVE